MAMVHSISPSYLTVFSPFFDPTPTFQFGSGDEGHAVMVLTLGGLAEQSGLKEGDTILAVNGQRTAGQAHHAVSELLLEILPVVLLVEREALAELAVPVDDAGRSVLADGNDAMNAPASMEAREFAGTHALQLVRDDVLRPWGMEVSIRSHAKLLF